MNRKDFIKSLGAMGAGIGAIWKLEQEMQPEPKEIEPPELPDTIPVQTSGVVDVRLHSIYTTEQPYCHVTGDAVRTKERDFVGIALKGTR